MLTVDLLNGQAYQRCWDSVDCAVAAPPSALGGPAVLKARHALGRPPAAALPALSQLWAFEAGNDDGARAGRSQDDGQRGAGTDAEAADGGSDDEAAARGGPAIVVD